MTTVGKWFSANLGIALGIFTALVSIGFVVALSIAPLTTKLGWRPVWQVGGLVLVALAGLVWFAIPRKPPSASLDSSPSSSAANSDATLVEALRAPVFWIFTACTGAYYLTMTGMTLFYEDVMLERELDRSAYEIAMAAFLGAGLFGNIGAGLAARRADIGYLLGFTMILMAVYLFGFRYVDTPGTAAGHAALFGFAGGAFSVVFFTGYARSFGRTHLGKIQGVAQTCMVIASAFGPRLFAETKAASGSYGPLFSKLAPIMIALGVVAFFSSKLGRPRTSDQTGT